MEEEEETITVENSIMDSNDNPFLNETFEDLQERMRKDRAAAMALLEEEDAVEKEVQELRNIVEHSKEVFAQTRVSFGLDIPPHVNRLINEYKTQISSLQEELKVKDEKSAKNFELYSELYTTINETAERLTEKEKNHEEAIARIQERFSQKEQSMKDSIERYKSINTDLLMRLNTREAEIDDFKTGQEELNSLKESLEQVQNELKEAKKSLENNTKLTNKLKAQCKKLQSERDSLKKEKELSEDISLKDKITLLEEEKGNLQLQLIDLDEIKEAAQNTQEKYNLLEKEVENLRNNHRQLLSEQEELSENYKNAKQLIKEQEETINMLKNSLESVTQERISAMMKSVEYEELCFSKDKELVQLKEALETDNKQDELITKASALENQITELIQSEKNFRNEITALKTELNNQKEENCSLINKIDALKKENSGLKKDDSDNSVAKFKKVAASYKLKSKQCQELEAKVKQLEADLKARDETIDTLNQEKEDMVENYQDLEADRASISNNINLLREELNITRMGYEQECKKNDRYTDDLRALGDEIDDYKVKLDNMATEYENLLAILGEKEDRIRKLELEVKNTCTKLRDFQTFVDQNNQEIFEKSTAFASRLEAAESEIISYQRAEDILKNKIINLEVDLDDAKEIIEVTQIRNNTLEKELIRVTEENENLDDSLSTIKESNSSNLEQIEVLNSKLSETSSSLEAASAKVSNLEKENESLNTRIENLKECCDEIEKELEDAKDREIKRESEFHIFTTNQSFDITQYTTEIDILTKAKDQTEAALESSQNSYETLRTAYVELQDELTDFHNCLAKKDHQMDKLREEMQKIKAIRNEADNELMKKCDDINQLAMTNIDLEKQIDRLKDRLNEIDRLVVYNADLERQVFELEAQLSEMDELRCQNIRLENRIECLLEDEKELFAPQVEQVPIQSTSNDDKEEKSEQIGVFTWGDDKDNALGDIKDEEDGWGWMGSDLEQHSDAMDSLKESHLKVQKLEEECERLNNELKASNTKCKKLVKKVKDMQLVIEKLEKNKSPGLNDLDFELQKELMLEKEKLESKLTEVNNQLETVKSERDSYIKRVDTLTTANEKLIDMKERQDIEVQMWQKQTKDLNNRIQSMRWTFEDSSDGKNEPVHDLPVNNTEIEMLKNDIKNKEAIIERLTEANNALKEEISKSNDLKQFDNIQQNEELVAKINYLSQNNEDLQVLLKEKDDKYENIILNKDEENAHLICTVGSKEQIITNLTKELEQLKIDYNEFNNMKEQIKSLLTENENLKKLETQIIENDNPSLIESRERLQVMQHNYNLLFEKNETLKQTIDDLQLQHETEIAKVLASKTIEEHKDVREVESNEKPNDAMLELAKEKERLEILLKEKIEKAESIEKELVNCKNESLLSMEMERLRCLIEGRDKEIIRQSVLLAETQEKLVRMEEAKNAAESRSLQTKLDQALCTLHLRDMRCDELTQEIMQLLEERDCLQFRLSESLRAYDSLWKNPNSYVELPPARADSVKVEYKKDPVIQLDRENRHNEQMQLLRNDPAPADTSNDYGIFNWFFGGTSPSE